MKSSRKNGFHHPHLLANTALVAYRLADTCIPELKGICENSTPSNSTVEPQKKKDKKQGNLLYHHIPSIQHKMFNPVFNFSFGRGTP